MKPLALFAAAALLLLAGCKPFINEPDTMPPAPPKGLTTSTGDGFVELFWDASRENDVAGYNIYVSPSYSSRYELLGSTREPYYVHEGATNGLKYYYAVTAYDYDGNESDLSKETYDIPRPEGYDIILSDYRRAPETAAYDFSRYTVTSYSDLAADIYYENYNGTLYMDVDMNADIQDMGYTSSLLDITVAPTDGWSSTHDAELKLGHTYVVWTRDDHYGKFRVTALSPNRVVFDWAYQLQEGTPLLKRPAVAGERAPWKPVRERTQR